MPKAEQLDLSLLPPASRRELRDFYQFLLSRQDQPKHGKKAGMANARFSDLCGRLAWKGDAVQAQRALRDEW